MVLNDRRLTIVQIAKSMDISCGSVHRVLSDILGISKLSARSVPRMLTPEQKLKRADISKTLLTRFQSDLVDFHHWLVTQNKTWVHQFEPGSKIQSKQWKYHGSPLQKKFKWTAYMGNEMTSVLLGLRRCSHDRLSIKREHY